MATDTEKAESSVMINPLKGRRNSFVEVAIAAKKIEQKVKPAARFALRRDSKEGQKRKQKEGDKGKFYRT